MANVPKEHHGEPQQPPKGASCKQLPINNQLDCAAEVRFNVQAEAVQTELAIHMPSIYYTNLWQLLSVNVSERGEEIDFLKKSMALDESLPFIPRRIIILKCNKIFFCIKLRCLKCRYLNLVDCLVNLRKTFLYGTSFLFFIWIIILLYYFLYPLSLQVKRDRLLLYKSKTTLQGMFSKQSRQPIMRNYPPQI